MVWLVTFAFNALHLASAFFSKRSNLLIPSRNAASLRALRCLEAWAFGKVDVPCTTSRFCLV